MQSPFFSTTCANSFLYFCKFSGSDEQVVDLASFISSLKDDSCSFGFDRSLWSGLSSGQMPSQLYSLNFYGSKRGCSVTENVLVIFSKSEIKDFPEYLSCVHSLTLDDEVFNDGDMVDSFEEDDEFENCLYGTCLVWDKFESDLPVVSGVKNIWLKSENKSVQLLLGKSIYSQDEWLESFFKDEAFNNLNKVGSAVHLLMPCPEKLKTLEEAVLDKERIHLDSEIKGIYC